MYANGRGTRIQLECIVHRASYMIYTKHDLRMLTRGSASAASVSRPVAVSLLAAQCE